MSETSTVQARLIGAIFVEKGLISEEELERALELQQRNGGRLGEILVTELGVSRVELAGVLADQWADLERTDDGEREPANGPESAGEPVLQPDISGEIDERRPIGSIFVERGFVTDDELELALETQRQTGKRLGEVLVEQGSLTRLELASALAEQWAGLQKLRPPEPKPAEPWQQVAPLQPLEPVSAAARPTPSSRGETDELRQAVAALEERLQGAEAAVAREHWRDELRATADGLAARLDALETRLGSAASRDDLAGLDELRGALETLRERVAEPVERLVAVERRLDELPSRETVDERVGAAVAEVGGRLDEIAGRLVPASEVEALRASLAALEARLESRGADAALVALIDELAARMGAAEDRVGALSARVDGPGPQAAELDELRARVQELAAIAAEARDLAAVRDDDRLESITAELDRLREGITRVGGAAAEDSAMLTARLESLVTRLDELAAAGEAGAPSADSGAVEALRVELAALAGRLERSVAESRAVVSERADAEAASRATFEAAVGERLDALAASAARGEGVETLREALADTVRPEALHVLRERLDADVAALAAQVAALQSHAGQHDHLDEARRLLEEARTEAGARIDALESRVAEGATRVEVVGLAGDLRAQLAQLAERLGALPEVAGAERVAEVQRGLEAAVADVASSAARAETKVDELAEALVRTQSSTSTHVTEVQAGLSALRAWESERLEALAGRVDAVEELEGRIGALEGRDIDAVARRELEELGGDLRAQLAWLAERVAALPEVAGDVEKLAEVQHSLEAALAAAATCTETRIAELEERLAEGLARTEGAASARLAEAQRSFDAALASTATDADNGIAELQAGLAALAGRVGAAEKAGARIDALETRIAERVTHDDLEAHAGALRAQLAELAGRVATLPLVAGEAERLAEAQHVLEAAVADMASAGIGTETRLGELEERLARGLARAEDAASARLAELQAALAALAIRVSASEELERNMSALERRVSDGATRAELEERTGELRVQLADLGEAASDRDEWRGSVEAGLDRRLDELAARLAASAAEAHDGVAGLAGELASLRASTEDLQGLRAGDVEEARAAAAELAARLDETAQRVAATASEREAELRAELAGLVDRVGAAETAVGAAGQELASELERLAASLGWRLEQVEQALAGDRSQDLETRLAALEQRLQADSSRAEEQARVTERALRKGLAALGERLAESETAYVEAGDALRRSIERLGLAIVDADVRIDARGDDHASAARHVPLSAHVAFVPTADGYRLVAVDAPPPSVGELVELEEHTGPFVVTRVGPSLLPLDTRLCAYLEPVRS